MNDDVPILPSRDGAENQSVDPETQSAVMLRHGSMELSWYSPKRTDPPSSHDQDELYIVIAGRGWFVRGGERGAFRPGDALFAAAAQPHRFEDFTPDLALWVMLYGPVGGEVA